MSSSMSSKWRWGRRYSTWGWRWGRRSTRSRLRLSSNNNLYLPEELLEEILSWLLVKSLFHFVQKSWSTLFQSLTFIAKHLLHHQTRTKNPSILVMSSDSIGYGFTLYPDDDVVRIVDFQRTCAWSYFVDLQISTCLVASVVLFALVVPWLPTLPSMVAAPMYFPYGIQQSKNVRSFVVPHFLSVLFFHHIMLQNFLHLVMINILMTTRWLELLLTTRILHLPKTHSSQLFTP